MILFLDNNVLPGIKPDLSDLVESFAENIIRDDVYHNIIVDKYEMTKRWKVPFIDLVGPPNEEGMMKVKIGVYDFDTIKRGKELIWVNSHYGTLYNFKDCSRQERPICFSADLKSVEAKYKNLGNTKSVKKYCDIFGKRFDEEFEYSNELVSFTFKFCNDDFPFEIKSEDLIHKLISKKDIRIYKDIKAKYKKTLFWSTQSRKWYDYGEARSLFNLNNLLFKIDTLQKNGLRYQDIDFETFGTKYINGEIIEKFGGFTEYDDLISSIASSNLKQTEGRCILELNKDLSSRLIPYYRFLLESLLFSTIEQDKKGSNFVKVDKRLFKDSEFIIPYLIFNVMKNIDNENNYIKYVHTRRYDSDEKYSQLVNFKEATRCLAFELRIRDILMLQAKDTYDVSYCTGDRDDQWFSEQHIKLEFKCEIDTATIFAIKQAIPELIQDGNIFEYREENHGHCDRSGIGCNEDLSNEYKVKIIICLCKAMYSLYKSGIWDNNNAISK